MPTVMRALLEARSAYFADVESAVGSSEPRLLVRSDLTGTMQLYELVDGELVEQTSLPDPVGAALYVPGTRFAVLQVDATGNEHHQLYLLDLDATGRPAVERRQLDALTAAPEFGHHLAGVSPDGTTVAYLSNRRNGVDFDLCVCDLGGREHRVLYTDGGYCMPSSGFSPDGRYVAVARPGPRPLDFDLLLVDVRTGESRVLLPHPDEAAEVRSPAWVSADVCFVSSNVGRDRAAVVRCDLSSGETVVLRRSGDGSGDASGDGSGGGSGSGDGAEWDAVPYTSSDGKSLLVVENHNGASAMRLFDARDLLDLGEVEIAEPGVVDPYIAAPPKFHPDGSYVFHSLTTPRRAADVWVTAAAPRRLTDSAAPRRLTDSPAPRRLTDSPALVPPGGLSTLETAEVTAFDGETIPLFFFMPASSAAGEAQGGRLPVVVIVHGGPEAQATQMFNPIAQALASSGYGVVVPNVRGSTGYGKRYAGLDDRTRRLDSVRDLASVHAWLAGAGFDPERAALWGGSYGGYMVLAGLAFQPELWAAGVDIVGISDLVTFLEHTSDYRRAHREREYGSLTDDRAFLERASPLRSADRIRAPLFVIHGRNDPRVPVSEAEQLVARLGARGVRCELEIYEDEGHGLARLSNRIDAYTKALAFLDSVLVPVSA